MREREREREEACETVTMAVTMTVTVVVTDNVCSESALVSIQATRREEGPAARLAVQLEGQLE